MSELREALSLICIAAEDHVRNDCMTTALALAGRIKEAKALLARPEPDIEDEVNEGVWQLKLEGDRQDPAVFEAFGSFEPAAAEKPSAKYCCFEDCDQEAVYCAGHVEDEKRIAVEQYQIRQAAAAEKSREWNNEAEQLELLADRLTWPQPIRQDLDLAEAAIREYIKLRFYVPSPPAATGETSTPILDEPDPEETSDDPPRAMDFIPPHLSGGCS